MTLSVIQRLPWRLVLAVLLTLALTPVTTSTALPDASASAFDYLQVNGLSKVQYDYATEVTRTVKELDVGDGVKVYLEITRPSRDDRRYLTILEASPYTGRSPTGRARGSCQSPATTTPGRSA